MRIDTFFCLLLCFNIKHFFMKCLCSSSKPQQFSSNYIIYNNEKADMLYQYSKKSKKLSFRNKPNKLGVIYEDIEYASIHDKKY